MAFQGEIGWIGKTCPDHPQTKLHTFVGQSGAGYFVATRCPDCWEPYFSRESHYYDSKAEVVHDMLEDRVRWRDADFHPGPMDIVQLEKPNETD